MTPEKLLSLRYGWLTHKVYALSFRQIFHSQLESASQFLRACFPKLETKRYQGIVHLSWLWDGSQPVEVLARQAQIATASEKKHTNASNYNGGK